MATTHILSFLQPPFEYSHLPLSLCQGQTRTVDLRSVTTTTDADADVNVCEALLAEEEDGLEDLRR